MTKTGTTIEDTTIVEKSFEVITMVVSSVIEIAVVELVGSSVYEMFPTLKCRLRPTETCSKTQISRECDITIKDNRAIMTNNNNVTSRCLYSLSTSQP